MPRPDWLFVDIPLFLCSCSCFCFCSSCLTRSLTISCFCSCSCFSCLTRSLTISCFFFFCLKLAVNVIDAGEVKSSGPRRSRSLISLFHSFVCWAEVTTARFQIEEDFEVKSSEPRRSRKLTFFCHIFACWFSLLSSTISWFMMLRAYQDWIELVSASSSDLAQIWLRSGSAPIFFPQHLFVQHHLPFYITFYPCHKHIPFELSAASEYYLNRSSCTYLLLYS